MTIPNLLTVLRLLAAPAVAVMFLYFSRPLADWVALILFVTAAATDWLDGHLARTWRQESKLGAMLDPIADKAMVVIALLVLTPLLGAGAKILLPATLILFREVFVSGLREYLGDTGGQLKVTKLAKWKTTAQMLAIALLFGFGLAEHYLGMLSYGMTGVMVDDILSGAVPDEVGLRLAYGAYLTCWFGGYGLLWVATALTLFTGWDYFRKALPHLRDDGGEKDR